MARRTKKSGAPRRSARGLSARAAAFVREYLIDLNGAAAAVRAGYAPRSAAVAASRLLQSPVVTDAISAAQSERAQRTAVTADEVVQSLAAIMRANVFDFIRIDVAGKPEVNFGAIANRRDLFAAVSSIDITDIESGRRVGRTTRIRLHDKQAAATTLLRHLGALPMNVHHSGIVGTYDATEQAAALRLSIAEKLDRLAQMSDGGTDNK
ncbi:terminase small subunit [Rhodomicrobium vannielii ATCC 17100]|uniref:terminase small subunit n=1 Tax=Rhodomicrobium vannielii TaxID=1069 RepID=UPI00191B64D6|nr:terminase small subunit [Rhodomicrobium vannielii]MBJ7534550.1 terminase small subunit [Rhodomicrobium vannielii ATCC 17100]